MQPVERQIQELKPGWIRQFGRQGPGQSIEAERQSLQIGKSTEFRWNRAFELVAERDEKLQIA